MRARNSNLNRAFSLVEVLLAVSIMGVIIYVLYMVFNQTQRALRNSETQGDVSERGRAILEMVSREVEQAVVPLQRGEPSMAGGIEVEPRLQKDDRNPPMVRQRTNVLHNLYFLNKFTNQWSGVGYRVVASTNGVGSLLRFSTNMYGHAPYNNQFYSSFRLEPNNSTNLHHVADGVVHFRVIPFDPNGQRLGFDTTNHFPGYNIIRLDSKSQMMTPKPIYSDTDQVTNANVVLQQASFPRGGALKNETLFTFVSNALPAYLDLELGVLEPDTLRQYQQMLEDQNPNAGTFLAQKINKVHLFRQRIHIPTTVQ